MASLEHLVVETGGSNNIGIRFMIASCILVDVADYDNKLEWGGCHCLGKESTLTTSQPMNELQQTW